MYSKLFGSMFDGTLRTRAPWQALVTFQQMLILCDPTGVCDMTAEAVVRKNTIRPKRSRANTHDASRPAPERARTTARAPK